MAKKSIAVNYIYNLIYQVLTILLPLITTPYLSRVLGAESIGIYGYTLSIATYFVLFASLGIAIYGQREIAYHQNDKAKQSKIFWEMVIIRFITFSIAIITFYLTFCKSGDYSVYYKILILELLAAAIDISWYFQGVEDFGKTVIRNSIIKTISVVCIFMFVKTQDDLSKYIFIYTLSNFLGIGSMWLYIPKMIEKVSIKTLEIKKRIKPIIALFIPQVATQIYVLLDKTMIGNLTNNMSEVGFYEQAQKIERGLLLILTALGTVMSSRIANAFSENKKEDVKKYILQSFNILWLLGLPMTFGMIGISSKLVPWFYGEGYEPVIPLLNIMSTVILIIGLSNITGVQYLIQMRKQKIYTISIIIGVIVNIICNFVLIKMFGTIGAAISSIIAEMTILIIQLIYIRKEIKIFDILKLSIKYLIASLVMYIVIAYITNMLSVSILNTAVEIIIGGAVYLVILIILKDKFLKDIINQVYVNVKSRFTK